jgi:hypothetical protein
MNVLVSIGETMYNTFDELVIPISGSISKRRNKTLFISSVVMVVIEEYMVCRYFSAFTNGAPRMVIR